MWRQRPHGWTHRDCGGPARSLGHRFARGCGRGATSRGAGWRRGDGEASGGRAARPHRGGRHAATARPDGRAVRGPFAGPERRPRDQQRPRGRAGGPGVSGLEARRPNRDKLRRAGEDAWRLALLFRYRSGHEVAPRDDDLAQLGGPRTHLGYVFESHEADLAPRPFHVLVLARDDSPAVEHQADRLLVVLHEAREVTSAREGDAPVLRIFRHSLIGLQDDLAFPAQDWFRGLAHKPFLGLRVLSHGAEDMRYRRVTLPAGSTRSFRYFRSVPTAWLKVAEGIP